MSGQGILDAYCMVMMSVTMMMMMMMMILDKNPSTFL